MFRSPVPKLWKSTLPAPPLNFEASCDGFYGEEVAKYLMRLPCGRKRFQPLIALSEVWDTVVQSEVDAEAT
jgi:hypothetical protein